MHEMNQKARHAVITAVKQFASGGLGVSELIGQLEAYNKDGTLWANIEREELKSFQEFFDYQLPFWCGLSPKENRSSFWRTAFSKYVGAEPSYTEQELRVFAGTLVVKLNW